MYVAGRRGMCKSVKRIFTYRKTPFYIPRHTLLHIPSPHRHQKGLPQEPSYDFNQDLMGIPIFAHRHGK